MTAAGVGVASHDDGLVGNLAAQVAARTGRTVAWSVVGRTDATVADVSEQLLPELVATVPTEPWHLAVVAGVNMCSAAPTLTNGPGTCPLLSRTSGRAQRIAVTGVPPFERFPALPRALACYLAARGRALTGRRSRSLRPGGGCAGSTRTSRWSRSSSLPTCATRQRSATSSGRRSSPTTSKSGHWDP